MTNNQKITMNQRRLHEGDSAMHGWTEPNLQVVHARNRELELEAASERLAASARRATSPRSLRRSVGVLLISAGRRIAGEPLSSGSPAARPAHPAAA